MDTPLDLDPTTTDPLDVFVRWYEEAKALPEREAMTLATLDATGQPELRTVLLRGLELGHGREGLVFYTNYQSTKGRHLLLDPRCAALFYWGDLLGHSPFPGRQVRVTGTAQPVPAEVSDAYFASRPRLSQLGAWASPQSTPIASRDTLESAVLAVAERFPGATPVPRPPHWGGFHLVIDTIELWQGRLGRLHDRFRFARDSASPTGWTASRLAP